MNIYLTAVNKFFPIKQVTAWDKSLRPPLEKGTF